MLNVKDINRYFLRLGALPERPDIVGQVVFLRHVSTNGLVVSMTDDCRPLPQTIPLPPKANDDAWYEVTELILDANCAITPRYDLCAFCNETARQYRNYLEDKEVLRPCVGHAAEGRLCFLGREHNEGFEFSQTAYYVVSMDSHGFYIVYSGFCNPKKGNSTPQPIQRVLRLEGSGKSFFEAEPIVRECNSRYKGDIELRDKYTSAIEDRVASKSTATTHAESHGQDRDSIGVSGLQLS